MNTAKMEEGEIPSLLSHAIEFMGPDFRRDDYLEVAPADLSNPNLASSPSRRHMARGSRADGALANPVRSGRKQP